jgi:hypothetical protein
VAAAVAGAVGVEAEVAAAESVPACVAVAVVATVAAGDSAPVCAAVGVDAGEKGVT